MLTLFTFGLVTLAVAVVFAPILFALHLHRREERMATHGVTAVRVAPLRENPAAVATHVYRSHRSIAQPSAAGSTRHGSRTGAMAHEAS